MHNTWVLVAVLAVLGLLVAGDGDKETDHSQHGNTHDDKADGGTENAGKEFAKDEHHSWSYNVQPDVYGASKWNTLFADKCGTVMKHQSPIDIVIANTKHAEDLGPLDVLFPEVYPPKVKTEDATAAPEGQPELGTSLKGLEETPSDSGMFLFSNGHTVQVDVKRDMLLVGAGLGSQYKVAQFHFHWGKNGEVGSEHRIDGNMFMLEMHIVSFDSERFANLGEAVGQQNGIAVLGILFKGGKHNSNLNNVVNNLKNLPQELNQKIPIDWFDVTDVLPEKTEHYFRYTGSLTTPPCSETVKWTVFAEHPSICPSQMKQFYNLTEGHYADGSPVNLVNNWRPPQPLNGRTVYSSFTTEKPGEYVYDNGDENASSRALSSLLVLASCMCLALLRG